MPSHRLNPIADELLERIRGAKSEVVLVSPYIKDEILQRCLEASQSSVQCRVLTSLRLDSYLSGALDIKTLRHHIDSPGFTAHSVGRLHAKVFITDSSFCYIGSNNLTNNGLYRNVEMGVVIEELDEVEQVKQTIRGIESAETTFAVTAKLLDELSAFERPKQLRKSLATEEVVEPLSQTQLTKVAAQLGGWKGEVLSMLQGNFTGDFTLSEVYAFEAQFKALHPENNKIQDKLRQVLQQLRDLGLITFLGNGRYAVNW
jgi:phosphatidylserine/phosphatidylglycerophosphate/cardiolipin synthase-like enzyme